MKPLNARIISLVGFAASQWATERLNGSRHRKQYRQLITAGLVLHEQPELYASAPRMRRALTAIAKHAAPLALVVLLAGCVTPPAPVALKPQSRIAHIRVASLPPQSCIFMNGEFMGVTPLTIPVEADAEGKWKHGVRIQCEVPHSRAKDEYYSPEGFAVPRNLLFRVPGYETWYTSTQRYQPTVQ